jgi:ArsR family transcriptional regulator, zinc-responsive transcriptional repressor
MLTFKDDAKLYTEQSELLKALAHPVRLCIVRGLLQKGACNVSTMCDCLEMPQSTISQHLSKLKSAGIVEGERNGVEMYYRIANDKAGSIIHALF